MSKTFCFGGCISALLPITLAGSVISAAGFTRFNTALDMKSLTSAVPEAKYSHTQIADGHRMTPEMDEALKGDGVWKAGGLHRADVPGRKVMFVTYFPALE